MQPGDTFGPSSWIEIPQAKIDAFAEATGDHQWIHVDPVAGEGRPVRDDDRARLSDAVAPTRRVVRGAARARAGWASTTASTGCASRRRFPSARGSARPSRSSSVDEFDGGAQVTMTATVEREGGDKPVCVAEVVFRYYE